MLIGAVNLNHSRVISKCAGSGRHSGTVVSKALRGKWSINLQPHRQNNCLSKQRLLGRRQRNEWVLVHFKSESVFCIFACRRNLILVSKSSHIPSGRKQNSCWAHLKTSGWMGDSRMRMMTRRGSSRKPPRDSRVT